MTFLWLSSFLLLFLFVHFDLLTFSFWLWKSDILSHNFNSNNVKKQLTKVEIISRNWQKKVPMWQIQLTYHIRDFLFSWFRPEISFHTYETKEMQTDDDNRLLPACEIFSEWTNGLDQCGFHLKIIWYKHDYKHSIHEDRFAT